VDEWAQEADQQFWSLPNSVSCFFTTTSAGQELMCDTPDRARIIIPLSF
jgi:hypothetical protein